MFFLDDLLELFDFSFSILSVLNSVIHYELILIIYFCYSFEYLLNTLIVLFASHLMFQKGILQLILVLIFLVFVGNNLYLTLRSIFSLLLCLHFPGLLKVEPGDLLLFQVSLNHKLLELQSDPLHVHQPILILWNIFLLFNLFPFHNTCFDELFIGLGLIDAVPLLGRGETVVSVSGVATVHTERALVPDAGGGQAGVDVEHTVVVLRVVVQAGVELHKENEFVRAVLATVGGGRGVGGDEGWEASHFVRKVTRGKDERGVRGFQETQGYIC